MPTLSSRASGEPALGQLLILEDERAQSRVELSPTRGAIVTSFRVGARELLYLERDTLIDPSKNVRGGIPVLFPSPGKLTNDVFQREGKRGALKQHGFARNLAWTPSRSQSSSEASVALTLVSSEQTRAQFPWDFSAELRFSLAGTRLTLALSLRNTGTVSLPFAFGLHPYFVTEDKQHARIDTRATRVFDNVSKSERPLRGLDLTLPEVDLHLLDHQSTASALHFADGSRIDVRGGSDFKRWVIWTLAGKDFVCLEPWTAPFDALNTGESLIHIAAGGVHEGQVELELTT